MPGERARSQLTGTRFSDVRWVAETGSTQTDLLDLVRRPNGAPEGIVLVADHQTAGRGRQGRTWTAPPGASLLLSVLLRPPPSATGLSTMVVALAMAEAVEEVARLAPRLKWPNDLVWSDRKLAGILAEADWSAAGAMVVVGVGVNVNWPLELPDELRDIAVAINHLCGHDVDREDLLVAFLRRLDAAYGRLASGHEWLLDQWRARSATLGRTVRVDLGDHAVEGVADDVTAEGHLIVETAAGERHTIAAGDVVHVR